MKPYQQPVIGRQVERPPFILGWIDDFFVWLFEKLGLGKK